MRLAMTAGLVANTILRVRQKRGLAGGGPTCRCQPVRAVARAPTPETRYILKLIDRALLWPSMTLAVIKLLAPVHPAPLVWEKRMMLARRRGDGRNYYSFQVLNAALTAIPIVSMR